MSSTMTFDPRCASEESIEVAMMLAKEREFPRCSSTTAIASLYHVAEPGLLDPPTVLRVEHFNTGVRRRLLVVRRPGAEGPQERLREIASKLQSLRCDTVAWVLEVFEDCRSLMMIVEDCTGGGMQERIFQRRQFAEQEAAMLVQHVLGSLEPLHAAGMAHGCPMPDSFQFKSPAAHAALKLVDFGLELQVQQWDAEGQRSWARCTNTAAQDRVGK